MSVCLNTLPAAITSLPVLSFSGPLKMSKLPFSIAARTSSAFFFAASVTIEP